MESAKRPEWLAPAIGLIASWAILTVAVIGLASRVPLPPSIAKVVPFLLAGVVAGRLSYVAARRARIIATALLAAAACLGWTAFTVATSDVSLAKTLALLGLSIPVMLAASLWAYFGMFLASRGRSTPSTSNIHGDPELDDLERELRNEIHNEKS